MNELAVIQSYNLDTVGGSADLLGELRATLGDEYRPDFAFAKTPSSARTVWDIKASADDEDPEMVKAIEGVIIHAHKNYAWWAQGLDAGAASGQPDCRSNDGVWGMTRDGEMCKCADCPRNKFGSDGNGKACKNGRRLYVFREGDLLPLRIDLAPTGNKPFEKYVDGLLIPRKKGQRPMRVNQVVTRIGLKIEQNQSGTKYSVPTFESVGIVPDEVRPALMQMAESLKDAAGKAFYEVDASQVPAEFAGE